MKIALLETAPPNTHGSMSAYADLLAHALGRQQGVEAVERILLAPPQWVSGWFKGSLLTGFRLFWMSCACIAERARLRDCDLVHLTDGSHGYLLRWLPEGPHKVATVHDLIPYLQASGRFAIDAPGYLARQLINKSIVSLCSADHLVVDSASTRDDLIDATGLSGQRIDIIPLALAGVFREVLAGPSLPNRGPQSIGPLLHVGNNGFYKNRVGALRIFSKIYNHTQTKLIMVGPKPDESLQKLQHELKLADVVEFVVDPPPEHLVELYCNASLLLFPSLYEGFGWPTLEAMACGCPVVCSNAASLPEVVGNAALTCNPDDEEEMARLCLKVLRNPALSVSMVNKGFERVRLFTPERMGRELLAVYQRVVECGYNSKPKANRNGAKSE